MHEDLHSSHPLAVAATGRAGRDADPRVARTTIGVAGLRTGSRLADVERAVLEAPGVIGVDIDLATGTIAIDYEEHITDERRLREQLLAAGEKSSWLP